MRASRCDDNSTVPTAFGTTKTTTITTTTPTIAIATTTTKKKKKFNENCSKLQTAYNVSMFYTVWFSNVHINLYIMYIQ